MEMEKSMIHGLANDIAQGRSTVDFLLAQTEVVKNVSRKFSNVGIQSRDDYSRILYSEWFAEQISDMQQPFAKFEGTGIIACFNKMRYFPTANDLTVVLRVLLDLQQSSSLKARDITKGRILDTVTGKTISPALCYRLAKLACRTMNFYNTEMCNEWIEQSRIKLLHDPSGIYYEISHIEELLLNGPRAMADYSRLCSASISRSYWGNNPALKCFLWDNNRHPLLVLQPVRAELFSVDPIVVMFYDVISSKDIAYVKNVSEASLVEAKSSDEKEDSIAASIDSYRVAHNNWMDNSDDPVMMKLDKLVEAITRLPFTEESEDLQVANYGVGGHYKPHYDAFILKIRPKASLKRRATYMYYLSDVQYGGATVFPKLGIAVRPVKGAALFWHNLIWNSQQDLEKRSLHAGCPVLLGNKWVANKWIRDGSHGTCQKHQYFI